eukprot:g21967.t1
MRSEEIEPAMNAPTEHYTVLARRFRPQTFDDVIGQQHVAQSLQNAIRSGRVAHAYLFTGARGVGKTSMARILAKALNCPNANDGVPCNACEICDGISSGNDVDVQEIDGASNRGIDDIRTLRANVNVKSMRTSHKVYIIDEVHMLTKEAFNALLKTLEEPPPNVKFVFCTTEPNKVPDTILSRCQRFDFSTIETQNIVMRLKQIADAEGFEVEPAALELVARRAAGSMRDSQSLFDQLLAFGEEKIAAADVHRMLGTAADDRLIVIVDALANRRRDLVLQELDATLVSGVELGELVVQLVNYFRDLMVLAGGADTVPLLGVSDSSREVLQKQADAWGLSAIVTGLEILIEAKSRMFRASFGRALVEMALIRISMLSDLEDIGTRSPFLMERFERHANCERAATTKQRELRSSRNINNPNNGISQEDVIMFKKIANIASMMKQAQEMQGRMSEMQENLANLKVEASAGGGMVKVEANGQQKILSVAIEASLMESNDKEMIEDLMVAAVNQALDKARETAAQEMAKITGDLDVPGLSEALEQIKSTDEKELVAGSDDNNESDFERLLEMSSEWSEDNVSAGSQVSSNRMEEAGDRAHDAMANMVARSQTLHESLLEQFAFFNCDREVRDFGEYLIQNLDANGRLQSSLPEIVEAYVLVHGSSLELDKAQEALRLIQRLDPLGVGARDYKECLLLQLTPTTPYRDVLATLITSHLDDVEKNRLPVIQRKTGYTIETIKAAIEELVHLNPWPGRGFEESTNQNVTPDLAVERDENGKYTVRLLDEYTPQLHISRRYIQLLKNNPDEATKEYIKKKIESARWLIDSIEQRYSTLKRVAQAIVDYQTEFLDKGPDFIVPLKMQQIADEVDPPVHVTTVSRAVDGKWIQAPRGLFPLKRFFGGGTQNAEGEEVAWENIRRKLKEIVDGEDKQNPLSDDALVKALAEQGITLARRTVTKYRKAMNIPSSRQRREY